MRIPCAVVLVAFALAVPAHAQEEQTWDPSKDEGVPEEQLVKAAEEGKSVPGARVARKPVAKAAEPDAEAAPQREPEEEVPIVKVKRKKPARERAPEAEADVTVDGEAVDGAARAKSRGGQHGSRRVQVFLVPVGEAASLAAGPVQMALEAEVAKLPGFRPVDLVEELAVPPGAGDKAKMDEARRVLGDGNKQLVSHEYGEAANRFRRAVRLMEEAGFAVEATDLADAYTRLAVALQLAGEDDTAKDAFRQAARIDLANMIDGRQVDRHAGAGLDTARGDVAAAGNGALSVVTSPAGARVFLGGTYRGTTPITIDRAPAGINFLRVDRPGAFPVVKLVDVKEAQDTPVKIKMKFTPEALELQKTLVQVPRALGRTDAVPDMVEALGRRFRLERAVVATVEMEKTNVAGVRVAVFDFPREIRLVDEKQPFVVDVEGGLQEAVATWARVVFDKADGSRNRAAPDPLDRSDGTEDWYSTNTARTKQIEAQREGEGEEDKEEWERSNYRPETYRKKSEASKDPLDHSDGTEEW